MRALRGLDPRAEELFDLVYWTAPNELPDPAALSPDERAVLAERLRKALAEGALGRG